MVGKYVGSGKATLTLKGKLLGKAYERKIEANFLTKEKSTAKQDKVWIEFLWASRRIGHLLNQIRLHGVSDEVKKEVIKISKKYGIPTPYTSFLVREDMKNFNSAQIRRRANRNMGGARRPHEGRQAVEDADEANELEKSSKPASPGAIASNGKKNKYYAKLADKDVPQSSGNLKSRVIKIGTKTFYLVNKQWVDSTITEKDKESKKAKMFSDDFFKLLREIPGLNKYVARGSIRVKIKGKVYNLYN